MSRYFAQRAREPMSSYTHFWGAVASVAATVLMVLRGIFSGASWLLVLGAGLFGLSLIALYTASSVYHFVVAGPRRLLRLRKLDHSMIYVLIAGSYTPICMTVLRQAGGIPLLAVIWALALAGSGLTVARLDIPRWLTSAIYLFMGCPSPPSSPSPACFRRRGWRGWCWAACSTRWAACSTPSNGRGGTTPASAATRSSTSSFCWAPCVTSC